MLNEFIKLNVKNEHKKCETCEIKFKDGNCS